LAFDRGLFEEPAIRLNEAILDKVRLGCRIPVDAQLWHDMDVRIQQDTMSSMLDRIVFQFETTAFQEKLPPQTITKTVKWHKDVVVETRQPKSPWQFLKDRALCSRWWYWLFKLFPEPEFHTVEYLRQIRETQDVTLELQHSVIYPEAKAIASGQMGSVVVRWVESEWE
jgi:hypothetical protein